MSKTLADTSCEPAMALAWAVSAKNALQNKGGYSPNQLVFGYNTNLPTVLTDLPPALESTTSSEIVRKNLEAMHKARENYIKAESSERIRRALRHRTRTSTDHEYEKGEKVYYKRKASKGWKGPAIVIGKEGTIVLVRHGSVYYRCHPCHLMKVNDTVEAKPVKKGKKAVRFAETSKKSKNEKEESSDDSDVDDDRQRQNEREGDEENEENEEHGENEENEENEEDEENDVNVENNDEHVNEENEEIAIEEQAETDGNIRLDPGDTDLESSCIRRDGVDFRVSSGSSSSSRKNDEDAFEQLCRLLEGSFNKDDEIPLVIDNGERTSSTQSQVTNETPVNPKKRPIPNTYVSYNLEDGTSVKAMVLSRQPKRQSKYGRWVNVQVKGDDQPSSVNWDDVTQWEEIHEEEYVTLLSATEELSQEVVDAKEKEIRNLIENDVYEVVKHEHQSLISSKWVFTEKVRDGKKVVKARLVARGFEEKTMNSRTDSPTCSRQSLRLAFVTAPTMQWDLHSLDVTSAFLQGNEIERDLYLQPPPEFCEEGTIWKLKRCIYGLNDAPRAWYERIEEELLQLGGKTSIYDEALFLWHRDGLEGILVSHVDDFVFCGRQQWHQDVIDVIMAKFKISSHSQGSFKYVGLNVIQKESEVLVDQCNYIDSLKLIKMEDERLQQKDEKLTTEKIMLRSISGQLLWATTQTRPDVAYDSCIVSNYGKEPTVRHLISANKAVKKLKSSKSVLMFPSLGEPSKMKVIVYADATHASLPSGASHGAFIVFLSGNDRVAPIMWQSKKLNRVTKSPLASETMEIAEGADAGFLTASMVQEVFLLRVRPPVHCFTDSRSLTDFLKTSHVIQDTRLRVDVARIREMVKLREIKVDWVEKERQLADPMTKSGAPSIQLMKVLRDAKL